MSHHNSYSFLFRRAVLPVLSFIATANALADVKLPSIFSDHMVLQQSAAVPVWGWAAPGESVTVSIGNEKKATKADKDGNWTVKLDPIKPEPNLTLTVSGKNTITVQDVLVGEVWICSGQSNMEFPVKYSRNAAKEIASADYPEIRMYILSRALLPKPVVDNKGEWIVCTPADVAKFSAVGYFFGRELNQALKCPVGLINTSVGGTTVEAWTSAPGFLNDPDLENLANQQLEALERFPDDEKHFFEKIHDWESKYGSDEGNKGLEAGWAKPDFDDSGWKTATLPATFKALGLKGGGSVWFRNILQYPDPAPTKAFRFTVGNGSDVKTVYLNGVEIPREEGKPLFHPQKVWFNVPEGALHAGANTMVIRVYSHTDTGGISVAASKMGFPGLTASPELDRWHYQIENAGPELTDEARKALPSPPYLSEALTATMLFNGMINPLIPYGIRGAIWYQGESNVDRAQMYRRALPAMIEDWRNRWKEGDFPFYIVQLPNCDPEPTHPGSDAWAVLRDSQSAVAASVPNTGLAVTIDIGESKQIHPADKQDVGHRLALVALAKTYGKDLEYSGPVYQSMEIAGDTIRLKFTHADGLTAKGGPLKQFEIAGQDRKYVPADATIDGDTVVVSSPSVTGPVAVRYAWANDPAGCNLYNSAGLPASPFHTDNPQ